MFNARKYIYLMVVFSFLITSFPLHLWAEEGSRKIKSLDLQKTESQQEKALAQNQPRISFDDTRYDAGEVWEGEKVFHTFTVKNTGTAQLNIKKVKGG